MRPSIVTLVAALALTAGPAAGQSPVRVGIVSGPLGSFAPGILDNNGIEHDSVTTRTPGDSLGAFGVIVVDNLYRLQDLNAAAFKGYVEEGGVLIIINPKVDGFSKSWSPYDIFIGEYTLEGRITEKKHPLFAGFPNDKLQDFAQSNGPFVGNCSLTEPAKEWRVLAKHAKKDKNAVIVEAGFGKGTIIVTCTRFDQYNAKPGPTRLGDNLFKYALSLAGKR